MENKTFSIEPVSKDLLYMKVADAIYKYISCNNLQPGDKIPSERVLAEQFEIGRNSIREALRVLENQDVIEVKTGKGAFVKGGATSDSIYLKLVKVNFLELLEIKVALEALAIKYAIKFATKDHIDQMFRIVENMEAQRDKGIYDADIDYQFHRKLLESSGNKTVEQMVANLIGVFTKYWGEFTKYWSVLEREGAAWINTVQYHREILMGIVEKDEKRALDAHTEIYKIDIDVLNLVKT